MIFLENFLTFCIKTNIYENTQILNETCDTRLCAFAK